MHRESIWLIWRDDYSCTEDIYDWFFWRFELIGEMDEGKKLYRYMFNHRFTFVFSNFENKKKISWNFLSGCILFYFYLYQKFEVIHLIVIIVKIVTVLESLMALMRADCSFWYFCSKHKICVSTFLLPTIL